MSQYHHFIIVIVTISQYHNIISSFHHFIISSFHCIITINQCVGITTQDASTCIWVVLFPLRCCGSPATFSLKKWKSPNNTSTRRHALPPPSPSVQMRAVLSRDCRENTSQAWFVCMTSDLLDGGWYYNTGADRDRAERGSSGCGGRCRGSINQGILPRGGRAEPAAACGKALGKYHRP